MIQMKQMVDSNWSKVCRFISGCEDLHKLMYPSAGWVNVTDHSMTVHKITDKMTFDRVKTVVEHIREINKR